MKQTQTLQPDDHNNTNERYLSTDEAAKFLGITPGSLRNSVSMGNVPYYKLGRLNRFKITDLNQLLQSNFRGKKL